MKINDSAVHAVGLLVVLAILSAFAVLSTPEAWDAEPSSFEANALVGP